MKPILKTTQKHLELFGENIPLLSNRIRNTLVYEIEYTTGINVKSMNINVKGISMKK